MSDRRPPPRDAAHLHGGRCGGSCYGPAEPTLVAIKRIPKPNLVGEIDVPPPVHLPHEVIRKEPKVGPP